MDVVGVYDKEIEFAVTLSVLDDGLNTIRINDCRLFHDGFFSNDGFLSCNRSFNCGSRLCNGFLSRCEEVSEVCYKVIGKSCCNNLNVLKCSIS